MSAASFIAFLSAARRSPAMVMRYSGRNLSQLMFHARNDGFEFTAAEMADVIGKLEYSVITVKDRDPFDGTSRLWRQMWGRSHLEYLIDHVVKRYTDDELRALFELRDGATP